MTRAADKKAAVHKYEQFHRFAPSDIGSFAKGFAIPTRVYKAGTGKWVTYRSNKIDPATLKRPRGTVDYIHEHDAGVVYYLPKKSEYTESSSTRVPDAFVSVSALTRLGDNLGYCFVTAGDDGDGVGDEIEAASTQPLPELYATPDGKCLLVIQSKKNVLAMAWGGGLGVFARGIDG